MNTIATIIFLIIIIIFLALLYMSSEKNKNLEKAKANLKNDNSKLSDQVRKKQAEIDSLKREIRRFERGRNG